MVLCYNDDYLDAFHIEKFNKINIFLILCHSLVLV